MTEKINELILEHQKYLRQAAEFYNYIICNVSNRSKRAELKTNIGMITFRKAIQLQRDIRIIKNKRGYLNGK